MIAHIKGSLLYKSFDYVIIDVNGLGYQVFVPLTTFYQLPEIYQSVSLSIYTHVKEDAIHLYGFLTKEEKDIFQSLISISGVGPRLAKNILSGISSEELYQAIMEKDVERLHRIPGVGNKTARRLVIELEDKIKGVWEGQRSSAQHDKEVLEDVVSALLNLGYKSSDAENAINKIKDEVDESWSFEGVFKRAIHVLSKR